MEAVLIAITVGIAATAIVDRICDCIEKRKKEK